MAVDAHAEWQLIETGEFQNDAGGISARRNHEIVFQLLTLAVIQKVHAGVYPLKIDVGVVGNANDPAARVITDEVAALAIHFSGPAHPHGQAGRATLQFVS